MCGEDSRRPRGVGCSRSNGAFRTTRREALPYDYLQSRREWEDRARAWTNRQSHRTGMQQSSRNLATTFALCPVGQQNDTQLSDRVYAYGAYVWTKAGNAHRKDDRLMGSDTMGERDEPRIVISGVDKAA